MEKLTFTFTVEQTNLILAALGKQPFEIVAPLIDSIQKEANGQMAPPAPGKE